MKFQVAIKDLYSSQSFVFLVYRHNEKDAIEIINDSVFLILQRFKKKNLRTLLQNV